MEVYSVAEEALTEGSMDENGSSIVDLPSEENESLIVGLPSEENNSSIDLILSDDGMPADDAGSTRQGCKYTVQ